MPLAAGSAYVGSWVNYSRGYIRGATLTVPAQHATILLAVLVMLIGVTGIACWELVCFTVHHVRSTPRKRDGLFHQQQVILRTRMPAIDTIFRLLGIAFSWRSNTKRSILRTLPLIALSFGNIALFLAGGLFVSRITSTDSEVLARGKCGFIKGALGGTWVGGNDTERSIGDVLYQAGYTSYRDANQYARSCYGHSLDRSTAFCKIYTEPYIPSTRLDNATCPFAEKACLGGALSLDTGLVSSESLGINTRPEHEIHIRKKMTCAPLAIENYTIGWSTELLPGVTQQLPFTVPGDRYKYYFLGPQLEEGILSLNYTWAISAAGLVAQEQAYKLTSGTYSPGPYLRDSAFSPIADLNQTDGDITLLFLTNKVVYTSPVEDTWFKATNKGNSSLGVTDVYLPDQPFSAIGCVEQYQVCNGDKCSRLSGMAAFYPGPPPEIGFNNIQTAVYDLITNYLSFMQLRLVLQFLRNELLLANQFIYGGVPISSALGPDQWRTEMENLHNVSIAGWQSHGVLHAAPGNTAVKPGLDLHDYINPETSEEQLLLCQNQKFRSSAYSSFSWLGLNIVLGICITIIGLNILVPPFVLWAQQKWGFLDSRRAWIEDDMLQLQRITLEARGLGPWRGKSDLVPVLETNGEKFPRAAYEEGGDYTHPIHLGIVNQPLSWKDSKTPLVEYGQKNDA